MPKNTIKDIAFDQSGYLWLGTINGLIRYDGASFKTYLSDLRKADIKNSNVVQSISAIPDSKQILVRMRDGLVYSIKNGMPVLYSENLKDVSYNYELDGHFPSLQVFDKFNIPVQTLTETNQWNNRTESVLPVNQTDFIVLSQKVNTCFYYKDGVKQKEILFNCQFRKFLKSGKNNFILDTKQDLYLYDSLTEQFRKVVIALPEIKEAGTNTNPPVFLWDKTNDETYCVYNSIFYQLYFDESSRVVKLISHFSIKEKGEFWTNITYDSVTSTYFVTTLTDGFFQIQPKPIQTLISDTGPGNSNVGNLGSSVAILKTSDSTVLTANGFEFTNTAAQGITIKKLGNIAANRETIALSGDTAILCVQQNQLVYYTKRDGFKQSKVFNEAFNQAYRSFISLIQPEGDSVWVCSDQGIFSLKQNNFNVFFSRKPDAQSLRFGPGLFFRLSKNEILFSNSFGLFKLKTYPPYAIDSFPEMKDKQVSSIVRYKDMLLLTVYKYGLFIYKDNVFLKVPIRSEQEELNFCHSAYLDEQGKVWITTDKGLFRSSISSIVESVSEHDNQPFFLRSDERDGIVNTQFSAGGVQSFAALPNGQLFYSTEGGIITFNEKALNSKTWNRFISIEKIVSDTMEIEVKGGDSINLKPGIKLLSIELSVPNLGKPENVLLEYKLDNDNWKQVQIAPSLKIMLYGITSGHHQLVIRKRTGFESTDYVYKTLFIFREKFLYQQVWFYPVLAALFILLVLMIIKWRKSSINKQRKKLQFFVDEQTSELSKNVEAKELLINIISRDLISPLKKMKNLAATFKNEPESKQESVNAAIGDIRATSDNILSSSLRIINYMKYNSSRAVTNKQTINLNDVIADVIQASFSELKKKNVKLINKVPEKVFVEIDENLLEIILSNLISLSVNHPGVDAVQISFESNQGRAAGGLLKIENNGEGIASDELTQIGELIKGDLQSIKPTDNAGTKLGYILISELTRASNFFTSVSNGPDGGTVITVHIPDSVTLSKPDGVKTN